MLESQLELEFSPDKSTADIDCTNCPFLIGGHFTKKYILSNQMDAPL